jgi:hypothetical protein
MNRNNNNSSLDSSHLNKFNGYLIIKNGSTYNIIVIFFKIKNINY